MSDENGRQANDSNSYREFKSYDEIQEMKKEERIGVPYVAFAFKGEDFEINQCFVLGAGQTFSNKFSERKRNADQYRNGPLDPGSSYKFFVRGYTAEVTSVSCSTW